MSAGRPSVPPGRAGRLWLRGRLATAERGLDLLDRKLRILRREQERLRLLERRTAEELRRRG
ncbi:MAG TPA: V-type ATPase, D subunit, partial [Actinomycetes bacterium]|nr:V-type ATPase, D subunit [Actinomycetes bacterium]